MNRCVVTLIIIIQVPFDVCIYCHHYTPITRPRHQTMMVFSSPPGLRELMNRNDSAKYQRMSHINIYIYIYCCSKHIQYIYIYCVLGELEKSNIINGPWTKGGRCSGNRPKNFMTKSFELLVNNRNRAITLGIASCYPPHTMYSRPFHSVLFSIGFAPILKNLDCA